MSGTTLSHFLKGFSNDRAGTRKPEDRTDQADLRTEPRATAGDALPAGAASDARAGRDGQARADAPDAADKAAGGVKTREKIGPGAVDRAIAAARAGGSAPASLVKRVAVLARATPPEDGLNKTERLYRDKLESMRRRGEVLWYVAHPGSIRVAEGLHYRPDFEVVDASGIFVVVEIKGGWIEDDAIRGWKAACGARPYTRFVMIQYVKGKWTKIRDSHPHAGGEWA